MLRRLLITVLLFAAFLGIAPASVAASVADGPVACCCCSEDEASSAHAEDDDCCQTDLGSCGCGHALLGAPPAPIAWPDLGDGRLWDATTAPPPHPFAILPPPTPPPIG